MSISRFDKQFHTYDDSAIVQKKVAKTLLRFIDKEKEYDSILELGCGTGVFTKLYYKELKFNQLDLNDIFDTREYLKNIKYREFFIENMEYLNIEKYSLILSSSAFQWVDNLPNFLEKLSKHTDKLIFSIYIRDNFIEIDTHFKISLNYLSTEEIFKILSKDFGKVEYYEESYKLNFNTPFEVLKHIKNTGVTGFSKTNISKIKSFDKKELTYKVAYFKCKKE